VKKKQNNKLNAKRFAKKLKRKNKSYTPKSVNTPALNEGYNNAVTGGIRSNTSFV